MVTFEADRVEDLEREIQTSVDVYLEWCEEMGREPDASRGAARARGFLT
ncbi:MAG TPA: hypothetical protein VF541_00195 [Longimicrobium sp.]